MNTMPTKARAVRFTVAVADTRDTARAFLEDLRQPTVVPGSRGDRGPDRVRARHQGPASRRGTRTLELTAHPDTMEVTVHDPRLAGDTHAHP
jgi:hypothetical protein